MKTQSVRFVDIVQGTPQWFAWRTQGIGASDAAAIVGVSPYTSFWRLWTQYRYSLTHGKEGRPPADDNPFMRWGKENEDRIRACYDSTHNDLVIPACVEDGQMPFLRASLDGLNGCSEPVELKAPSAAIFRDVLIKGVLSTGYLYHWWQVQHQMMVVGSMSGWLLFWLAVDQREDGVYVVKGPKDQALKANDPITLAIINATMADQHIASWSLQIPGSEGTQITGRLASVGERSFELWLEIKVSANSSAQAKLVADCERFWELVQRGEEPTKDPLRDPYEPNRPEERAEWEDLAMARRILDSQITVLSTARDPLTTCRRAIDRKLLAMMSNCKTAEGAGVRITRYTVRGAIDYRRLVADGACSEKDLIAARSRGKVEVRISDAEAFAGSNEATAMEAAIADEEGEEDTGGELCDAAYAPATDGEKATWAALAGKRRPIDRQIGFLRKELQMLRDRRDAIDQRLATMMEPFASAQYAGLTVNKYWRPGRISATTLANTFPDVIERYRKPETVRYKISEKI